MDGTVSLADIAAVTNRNDGYGNGFGNGMGGWEFIFALMLLPSITNGGFFGANGRGEAVTEAGLCNAMNFNNLEGAVGRLGDQVNGVNTNLGNAVCNLGYETLRNFNSLEQQLASCCCGIEKAILENRFQSAQNTNAIIQSQEHGTQRILDWLCNQENRNLRDENMRNYIQSQFCGVPRFQPGTVYGSIPVNPFFGGFGNWNNNSCCNGGF